MIGFLRSDVFSGKTASEILPNGMDQSKCGSRSLITAGSNGEDMGFVFDISLGDCGMKTDLVEQDGVE